MADVFQRKLPSFLASQRKRLYVSAIPLVEKNGNGWHRFKDCLKKEHALNRDEDQFMSENLGKNEAMIRLGMDELRRVRGGFGITAHTDDNRRQDNLYVYKSSLQIVFS